MISSIHSSNIVFSPLQIIPAGPVPERSIPLVEIHIPPANKLPLPARSTAIPVTGNSINSENTTPPVPVSAKQVFRLETPTFKPHSQSTNKIASTFSGQLVAMPQSGSYAPVTVPNSSRQTTTLVTANQHPIPASISLTNAGPPPLIPARAISGIPNPNGVQILRPRLVEGKVIAAAPNVCVTERGTIVAAQLNKACVPSSGACVQANHIGQSPDANAMMHKMFSVVRGSENGVPITIANIPANVSRTQTAPQIAHVYPSLKNENSPQNTNMPNQNTNKTNQNTGKPSQYANNPNQNTNVPHQSTHTTHQSTHGNMNRTNIGMGKYRHVNQGSNSTVKKFSLNVGGGMGAVTTAVRSGMLNREKYQPRDAPRDTKHVIAQGGGYSVKINENNLQTKPGIRSTVPSSQTNINPNVSDKTSNLSHVTSNNADVNPTVSKVSPMPSEEIPMMTDVRTNENDGRYNEAKDDPDNVPISKRGSTWMYRRRKKKKVRFTYVKGKKNKKKEETENYEENGGFEQEFYNEEQISEHLNGRGRGIKRDHDGDGGCFTLSSIHNRNA